MASVPMSRRIVTAGGGAHRLAQLFMDSLTVEVVPFKEMVSQLKVTRQKKSGQKFRKITDTHFFSNGKLLNCWNVTIFLRQNS